MSLYDTDFDVGFVVKKIIGGFLQPLPLVLLLLVLAMVCLWFTRFQKTGKTVLSLATLGLFFMSLQPIVDPILAPIEEQYPTFDASKVLSQYPDIRYIVVLGGGHAYNPNWAPSSNVLNNSLPRIIEGIRIHFQIPGSQLIFTGGAASNDRSAAKSAQAVALSLGVSPTHIILSETPKDTEEEARSIQHLVEDKPFILVTSANHLPRAQMIFEKQGLHPIGMPANQLAITTPLPFFEKWIPQARYLSHFERVWYEYLGRLWHVFKGD